MPTLLVAVADVVVVGAVEMEVSLSPGMNPVYEIVKVGFSSPYALEMSFTFAVNVTGLIVYLYTTSVENYSSPFVKVAGI